LFIFLGGFEFGFKPFEAERESFLNNANWKKKYVLNYRNENYRKPRETGQIIEPKEKAGIQAEGTATDKPNRQNNHDKNQKNGD